MIRESGLTITELELELKLKHISSSVISYSNETSHSDLVYFGLFSSAMFISHSGHFEISMYHFSYTICSQNLFSRLDPGVAAISD